MVIENTGFVDVQVQKEHCKAIGDSCGVMAGDVVRTLLVDQEERREQAAMMKEAALLVEAEQQDGTDWDEQGRFDPDSEDEFDRDEELI